MEYNLQNKFKNLTKDENISLDGFVKRIRRGKKFSFVELFYAGYSIQCILDSKLFKNELLILTEQSFVQISGLIKELPADKYTKNDIPYELDAKSINILSLAEPTFSQECPQGSNPETFLLKRHLYLRDTKFMTITKLRAKFIEALRMHTIENDITEIVPAFFIGSDCESGATLFTLQHPGKSSDKPMEAYLTQSSQFFLEYAVPSVGNCYCLGPSFRAEKSHTRRHLTEFTHFEVEYSPIYTLDQHHHQLKYFLKDLLTKFGNIAQKELTSLGVYESFLQKVKMTDDILVLEHSDAIKLLNEKGITKKIKVSESDESDADFKYNEVSFDENDDIPEAEERLLIDNIGKIVFLTKFPKEHKSFYMAIDPNDRQRVLGTDVEVPGVGEIIGSGMREAKMDILLERMKECNVDPNNYKEYLDLKKYGSSFSSGFGLGVDRMLVWLLDLHSIREVVTFPRFPGHLAP